MDILFLFIPLILGGFLLNMAHNIKKQGKPNKSATMIRSILFYIGMGNVIISSALIFFAVVI